MPNNDIDAAWTTLVLQKLTKESPRRCDFSAEDVVAESGIGPDGEEATAELFDDLLERMRNDGLVRYQQYSVGAVYDVEITPSGRQAAEAAQ